MVYSLERFVTNENYHLASSTELDFLSDRSQRVKFASACYSEWGPVPTGIPQGTKLDPWLSVLMVNDLDTNAQQWKYQDDTTLSEVEVKGGVKSCAGFN